MNYFLIDYENTHSDGLKNINGISDSDTFIIFYSDTCKNITLDVISDILSHNISYKSFKVSTGSKNALDFQLSSYLGYLIGKETNEKAEYYIVSNDKGFDYICDFWRNNAKNVTRLSTKDITIPIIKKNTSSATTTKKKKVKTSDLVTLGELEIFLSKEDQPTEVLEIFNQYKTKVAISNGLSKKFKDSKKAGNIYKKLKPLLKEKNKS